LYPVAASDGTVRLLQALVRMQKAMNKRDFLKTAGAIAAESMLGRLTQGELEPAWGCATSNDVADLQADGTNAAQTDSANAAARTNWAGNLTYGTNNLQAPATVDELRTAVKGASKLRVLGARHSFSAIADSSHEQISLEHLTEMTVDEKAKTVTVGGGVSYSELAPWLDAKGYALHNLASLPGITVAGACATGTHGSGLKNGNLATAVSAVELLTADGNLLRLDRERDGERFLGTVVGLGAMGVVTRTTLDLQPTYKVAQSVYQDLKFEALGKHFEEIFASGYSVSVFTDWQHRRAEQVWVKRRLKEGDENRWEPELFGAKLAKEKLHPLSGHSTESVTEQEGIPGPWYDRLPHFRIGQTPSSGQELQTEYFVPWDHGFDAVLAVEKLHEKIGPHLFITELRTIAADRLWMSMAYERTSLAIHFTWKPHWPEVKALLPLIEAQLTPFQPRPHWGKLFTLPAAQLEPCYTQLPQFRALAEHYDPEGKFRNAFVHANLYAS
jgi:alditol oxidase